MAELRDSTELKADLRNSVDDAVTLSPDNPSPTLPVLFIHSSRNYSCQAAAALF
jgi:hypothetical protein